MKKQQPKAAERSPPKPEKPAEERPPRPREIGGPKGPEPTRYGDWESAAAASISSPRQRLGKARFQRGGALGDRAARGADQLSVADKAVIDALIDRQLTGHPGGF